MKLSIKIMTFITMWLLYGGMIALAIIFDGIYIQVCIDTAIMFITAIATYLYTGKKSKEQT